MGALEAAGVKPVETDLGEYILQLSNEHPVHIVAPAIEKKKEQGADVFSAVESFSHEQADDMTGVVLRRKNEPS